MDIRTKILLFIGVCLIITIYISFYTRIPQPPFDIIQCSIEQLTPDVLKEKQLVIINEPILTPDNLLKTIFAYQFAFSSSSFIEPNNSFNKTKGKYTIITSPFWNTTIDIGTPEQVGGSNIKYFQVNLAKNQVIILPPFWHFRNNQHKLRKIVLDDIISYCIYKFI